MIFLFEKHKNRYTSFMTNSEKKSQTEHLSQT